LQDQIKYRWEGSRSAEKTGTSFLFHSFGLLATTFGFTFCMTSLYLAMRGVMRLGGMVARGGPYEIAHPAPNWVWIFPASMVVGMILLFINSYCSRRVGGLDFLVLAWPALFLALGWNFLEFGFNPPVQGQGLVWGWVVCGVVFVIMGGVPLAIILKAGWNSLRRLRVWLLILQLAAVGLGIYGSVKFLDMLSGVQRQPAAVETPAATKTPLRAVEPLRSNFSPALPRPGAPEPRLTITFEHNTLEILPGESGVFYNGRRFGSMNALPSDAKQALEQAQAALQARLGH